MRRILAISLEEVRRQFNKNSRQDIKILAPKLLDDEVYNKLIDNGKSVKRENYLNGVHWRHSEKTDPNLIVEAKEFIDYTSPQFAEGPLCLAFANEKTEQDEHYHLKHTELYYSEAPIYARYRDLDSGEEPQEIDLPQGGVMIFGPRVVHKLDLKGMTLVLEFPAVLDDKKNDETIDGCGDS